MTAAGAERLLDRLAAGRTEKAATAGDRAEFSKALQAQVQRGVSAALSSKDGTVTLRLAPESLGQMKIRVRVDEGSVHASFEVSSPRTRETLERTLGALRTSLTDKGLTLESASIAVARAPVGPPERDPALPPLPTTPNQPQDASGFDWSGGGGGSPSDQASGGWSGGHANASQFVDGSSSNDAQILLNLGSSDGLGGVLRLTPDGRLVVDALA